MHFLAKQTVGKALNILEGTVSAWKINGYGDPSRKNNSRYTKIVRYLPSSYKVFVASQASPIGPSQSCLFKLVLINVNKTVKLELFP